MIMTAIICFCQVTVETCFANTALEVRPPDVYRAAYCAEVNRLLGFPKYEQINQDVTDKEIPLDEMILTINREPEIPDVRNDPISKLAAKLITGGDNLEYVKVGMEDARRNIKSVSSSELTKCNIDLKKIANVDGGLQRIRDSRYKPQPINRQAARAVGIYSKKKY